MALLFSRISPIDCYKLHPITSQVDRPVKPGTSIKFILLFAHDESGPGVTSAIALAALTGPAGKVTLVCPFNFIILHSCGSSARTASVCSTCCRGGRHSVLDLSGIDLTCVRRVGARCFTSVFKVTFKYYVRSSFIQGC